MDDIRIVSLDVCKIKNHYAQWAAKKGINYNKLLVMYVIFEYDGCTQSEIMNRYGIPKQTINHIVSGLMSEKAVKLEVDETENRRKMIRYTEKGYLYAKEILDPLLQEEDQIAKRMGAEKISKLKELFHQFETEIQNTIGKKEIV